MCFFELYFQNFGPSLGFRARVPVRSLNPSKSIGIHTFEHIYYIPATEVPFVSYLTSSTVFESFECVLSNNIYRILGRAWIFELQCLIVIQILHKSIGSDTFGNRFYIEPRELVFVSYAISSMVFESFMCVLSNNISRILGRAWVFELECLLGIQNPHNSSESLFFSSLFTTHPER